MAERTESTGHASVVVAIPAGRESLETLIGAVDAALASAVPGLGVRVELASGDARHEPLATLCAGDHRVEIVAPGTAAPEAEIVCELPPDARPEPRTLSAVVELMRSEGLASATVRLPGLSSRALRATAAGSGSRRLRASEVGLRSARRRAAAPPPEGKLAAERAEHLRHRARAATMRARMDRYAHRYSRERLQVRHERARLRLAEERLGKSSAGEWVRWRFRAVARRIAGAPAVVGALVRSARSYGRRARRFALDRWRSRGPKPG